MANNGYEVVHSGDENTTDYRLFYRKNEKWVSPFHDIPLVVDQEQGLFNMIVEIPRGTNAKMEISTKEKLNPIKQDVKNGKLRFVDDVSPYEGYLWHYGAMPQTWEDPNHVNPDTKTKGDNDPLDVCDISSLDSFRGEVKTVKVLGTLALIDEGETDWKIISIDVRDPLADELNDIDDLARLKPGFSFASYEWFRTYKIPAGKPANIFGFEGELKNKAYALQVVKDNHDFWKQAVSGDNKQTGLGDGLANSVVENSPYKTELAATIAQHVKSAGNPAGYGTVPINGDSAVAAAEQMAMRNSPHGATLLPDVLAAVASINVEASKANELKTCAGISNIVVDGTSTATESDTKGYAQFTVVLSLTSKMAAIYHAKTPNLGLDYGSDEVKKEVAAAGYDLVAAAFNKDGNIYIANGPGRMLLSFSRKDGDLKFAPDAPRLQAGDLPMDGSLLSEKAPSIFFTATINC